MYAAVIGEGRGADMAEEVVVSKLVLSANAHFIFFCFGSFSFFLSFFLVCVCVCVCVCAHILLLLIGFLMDQSRGSVSSVDQVSECCEVRKLGCQV